MKPKIMVALSGGVDSSVAAALLLRQGFEVEAVFMKNWSPETIQSLTDCPWEQDLADAEAVCAKLGIPFRSINFEKEYKERVVDYFVREYRAGRTPNPDVMCNREIKFAAFLDFAKSQGADLIATGHYAIKENEVGLWRGTDQSKDQSYFLYALSREQLSSSLFPLGNMTKVEVRQLARELDLPTAQKKDSQGICFIGHLDLKKYLQEQIKSKYGIVKLLPEYSPEVSFSDRKKAAVAMGGHSGVMFYTIGERAGELLDNGLYKELKKTEVPPIYVLEKDVDENILYLTNQHDDPDFWVTEIALESWQFTGGERNGWHDDDLIKDQLKNCVVQVRYQQKNPGKLLDFKVTEFGFTLKTEPLYAVAAGQSAVIYTQTGRVLGGGVIAQIIRS